MLQASATRNGVGRLNGHLFNTRRPDLTGPESAAGHLLAFKYHGFHAIMIP